MADTAARSARLPGKREKLVALVGAVEHGVLAVAGCGELLALRGEWPRKM